MVLSTSKSFYISLVGFILSLPFIGGGALVWLGYWYLGSTFGGFIAIILYVLIPCLLALGLISSVKIMKEKPELYLNNKWKTNLSILFSVIGIGLYIITFFVFLPVFLGA